MFAASRILRSQAAKAAEFKLLGTNWYPASAKKNPWMDPCAIPVIAVVIFGCGWGIYSLNHVTANHNDVIVNKRKPYAYRTTGQAKGVLFQHGRDSWDQSAHDLLFDKEQNKWVVPGNKH
jgi:hypothetical protein